MFLHLDSFIFCIGNPQVLTIKIDICNRIVLHIWPKRTKMCGCQFPLCTLFHMSPSKRGEYPPLCNEFFNKLPVANQPVMVPAALLKKLSIRFLKAFATTPSVAKSITIIATKALIATAAIITDPYCSKISFTFYTSFFLDYCF